jgi:hypothetical protein
VTSQSADASQVNLTRWTLVLSGFVALALIAGARFEAWSSETGYAVGFYALDRVGDMMLPPDLFARPVAVQCEHTFAHS